MKKSFGYLLLLFLLPLGLVACSTPSSEASTPTSLTPTNGEFRIPLSSIGDGKAHYYKVKADDGTMVTFFAMKSNDGVFRAAIDACDVCYKAGKGYHQEGDFMVCDNCGQRFASNKINEIKGGCNPAPLTRTESGGDMVIAMKDINANTWYMQYRIK